MEPDSDGSHRWVQGRVAAAVEQQQRRVKVRWGGALPGDLALGCLYLAGQMGALEAKRYNSICVTYLYMIAKSVS